MENLVQMRIVYASTKMCPYKKQNCNTRNEGLSISGNFQNAKLNLQN